MHDLMAGIKHKNSLVAPSITPHPYDSTPYCVTNTSSACPSKLEWLNSHGSPPPTISDSLSHKRPHGLRMETEGGCDSSDSSGE